MPSASPFRFQGSVLISLKTNIFHWKKLVSTMMYLCFYRFFKCLFYWAHPSFLIFYKFRVCGQAVFHDLRKWTYSPKVQSGRLLWFFPHVNGVLTFSSKRFRKNELFVTNSTQFFSSFQKQIKSWPVLIISSNQERKGICDKYFQECLW